MMDKSLDTVLNDCIDALANGESIEEILARYPADATTLRSLLVTAASLFELAAEPSAEERIASRRKFLQQAARPRSQPALWQRFALIAASIFALFAFAGGGLVWAADAALPGEPLYRIKRTVESVQLAFWGNNKQFVDSLELRRRNEVLALLQLQRETAVEFRGHITEITPERWLIENIPVVIDSATDIQGQPFIGAEVIVIGATVNINQAVMAKTIIIVAGDHHGPNETILPSITATPTEEAATGTPASAATVDVLPVSTIENNHHAETVTATPQPVLPQPSLPAISVTPHEMSPTAIQHDTRDDQKPASPTPTPTGASMPTPDHDDEDGNDDDDDDGSAPVTATPARTLTPTPDHDEDGGDDDGDDDGSAPATATPARTPTPTPDHDEDGGDDDGDDDGSAPATAIPASTPTPTPDHDEDGGDDDGDDDGSAPATAIPASTPTPTPDHDEDSGGDDDDDDDGSAPATAIPASAPVTATPASTPTLTPDHDEDSGGDEDDEN